MVRGFGRSERGLVRAVNEDAILVDAGLGLFAVADGFGGAPFAAVAAARALEIVHAFVVGSRQGTIPVLPYPLDHRLPPEANRLSMAVRQANAHVYAARPKGSAPAGTTMAALLVDGPHVHVVHAGDTRVYRARPGAPLEALTRDHTRAARLVEQGALRPEDVRFHPAEKGLTLALGLEADVRPSVRVEVCGPADRFLICSDGLTDMVAESRIATTMAILDTPGDATRLARVAALLVEAANQGGGEDNVSVVVVEHTR